MDDNKGRRRRLVGILFGRESRGILFIACVELPRQSFIAAPQ
jgi:hypothetical protein